MDEFYAAEERTPAHEVKDKVYHTTYMNDNAFDRIALSQLTGGEEPGEKTFLPWRRVKIQKKHNCFFREK